MLLAHIAHPRVLAMVLGPLALGGLYFIAAAPPTEPGAYVLTLLKTAHALPARVSARGVPDSDDVPVTALPMHRPDHFYLSEPARFDPPLDPASVRLSLVAVPAIGGRAPVAAEMPIPVTVTAVNPTLYSVRSPHLDGPWVRLRYDELAERSIDPTYPVLALTVAAADGQSEAVFRLAIERLW